MTEAAKTLDVRCAFNEMVDPSTLQPHPLNYNGHPAKQIEIYRKILAFQGWRRAITVSKRSGFITRGHGALIAAIAMGEKLVPVDRQEYDSEEQELADIAADNKLAELAETDDEKFEALLKKLDTGHLDMELTGMDQASLEELFKGFADAPQLELTTPPEAQADGAPAEAPPAEAAPDASHVRMVQLFLNEETVKEFELCVGHFQAKLSTENVTDTVLAVLKRSRDADLAASDPAPVPAPA